MEKISAVIMLEIMGRPEEYIKEAASAVVSKIGTENGIKVRMQKIADIKKLDNGFFSTFAEIELDAENLLCFTDLMFRYMPSHIEIISPASMRLESFDINSILNGLMMKLHKYDEVAKVLSIEKDILAKQILHLREQLGKKAEANICLEEVKHEISGKAKPEKKAKKKKR